MWLNKTLVLTFAAAACVSVLRVSSAGQETASPANGGKAEAVGRRAGEIVGTVAGGTAGEFVRGNRGALAGGAAGAQIGAEIGAGAGRSLDQHAAENQRSGRGGPEDPRY